MKIARFYQSKRKKKRKPQIRNWQKFNPVNVMSWNPAFKIELNNILFYSNTYMQGITESTITKNTRTTITTAGKTTMYYENNAPVTPALLSTINKLKDYIQIFPYFPKKTQQNENDFSSVDSVIKHKWWCPL